MVLINIGSLSDNELRNIASQEDLEDWETLSREDLIEALEDLYDSDEGILSDDHSGSSRRKFVNTLTDVQTANDLSLPGTEPLPENYNETAIHLVMKDLNWAYVFWSLSAQQLAEFEDGNAQLVIRNLRLNDKGEEVASYDIEVSLDDDSWTIELPHAGYSYQVCLIMVRGEEEKVLCRSTTLSTTRSWLSCHPAELVNSTTFRTLLSSIVLKGGTVLDNKQIEGLIDQVSAESQTEASK